MEYASKVTGSGILGEIDRLNGLAWSLREQNLPQALAYAQQAHDLSASANYELGLAWSLRTEGFCFTKATKYDAALDYLTKAQALFQQLGMKVEECRCLDCLGGLYRLLGDCPKAISQFLACLAPNLLSLEEKSDALNALGHTYYLLGDHSEATKYYVQSLVLRQEVGDIRRIGSSHLSLGLVHERLGNYPAALEHLFQSYQQLKDQSEPLNTHIAVLANIGTVYEKMENFPEALAYYQQGLDLPSQDNTLIARGQIQGSIGDIYVQLGHPALALNYYQQALQSFQEADHEGYGMVDVLWSLGTFYRSQQPNLALTHLQAALQRAVTLQLNAYLPPLHEALALTYEQIGDYAQAFHHYRAFHQYQQQADQAQAQQLLAQYEVEKSRQEADLLSKLNQELETQVAARTAELTHALTELKRLDRLKDDFVSTISHELRTPLSNMKMALHLLKTAPLDRQPKYLQILETECQREVTLVNNLLQLKRAEADLPAWEKLPLGSCLRSLLAPFQVKAPQQQQNLHCHWPDREISIVTELISLEQIVIELLNNACKFTPTAGTIEVAVKITGANWRFEVTNSGVHIPPEEVARVFERFYRIPTNDPWKQDGTGLGLALVQKLVTRLGGIISAESGSHSFTIAATFPCDPGS